MLILQSFKATVGLSRRLQDVFMFPSQNGTLRFNYISSAVLTRILFSVAPPKAHHDRLTLLKSIHVYKKHRVQYEVRTYGIQLTLEKLTGSTSSTFLEYIQRNLPEGVAMKTSMVSSYFLTDELNLV